MHNFNQQYNLYAMPNGYFGYNQATTPISFSSLTSYNHSPQSYAYPNITPVPAILEGYTQPIAQQYVQPITQNHYIQSGVADHSGYARVPTQPIYNQPANTYAPQDGYNPYMSATANPYKSTPYIPAVNPYQVGSTYTNPYSVIIPTPNMVQNSNATMTGAYPPLVQPIGNTPYGQSQIPYVPSSSVPMPARSVPMPSYQQPMMPPNPYVSSSPMLETTNMVSYQLQPPMNIGGINGQIQATPNFIQNGCQNLDSVEELKKKLEKNLVLKKECKDFTFIISNTEGIHIFFKRNNRVWIDKFSRKLWANMKLTLICKNEAIFIPLTYLNIEKNITDEEIIYFLTNNLQSNFFIKKINKEDYLKIGGQILCINSDNLLEKIESYECSYFFKTPEGNQLTQNFYLAINNDSYLFIDEKTKKTYSYDSLPKLKELENHLEEVKDYVG